MKNKDAFKCIYDVDDGYAGGSRPHSFSIWQSELDEDMTEEDVDNLFEERMQESFLQRLSPYGRNKESFINWALEVIETIKEENEDEDSDGVCEQ